MKRTGEVVVIERANLTHNLFLEKIAWLDAGAIIVDNQLPVDQHGIYYRVGLDCCDQGVQYITDYSGVDLVDSLVKFNVLTWYQVSDL